MNSMLKPLSMIFNEKSGFHATNNDQIYEQLMRYWTDLGFEIQVFDIASEMSIQALIEKVHLRHLNHDNQGVIVVAGGDGTLNSVANYLLHQTIPLAILPLGTFNYVARVLNIPLDILEAAKLVVEGKPKAVHVAKINDAIYLNNASLGLYPLFIKKRELYNQKLGRLPLHAYTSGLDVLIRDRKELKLEIEVDGVNYAVKTPLLFLGNNQLQLKEMNLNIAKTAEEGRVAGVVLARTDKLSIFKTLIQLVRGKLDQAADVYSFSADHVRIRSHQKKITVAIDGEIIQLDSPLDIHVERNALTLMVPQ